MFSGLKAPRNFLPASRQTVSRRTMTSNATRPANWKEAAPAPMPGPTFAAQSLLPKLPVPELSSTLAKLKESLRPIAWNETEWTRVQRRIEEFSTGLGPILQERLESRAKERDHWLEGWWDDLAYLGYRDSVCMLYRSFERG
jgi:carnitine O-acetyltransferase